MDSIRQPLAIPNLKTEYSFRKCFGHIDQTVEMIAASGAKAVAIADLHGTWGHIPFRASCVKHGIKPVFGVSLMVVDDVSIRDRKQANKGVVVTILAKDQSGLHDIYEITTKATAQFYYKPQISLADINALGRGVAVIIRQGIDWASLGAHLDIYVGVGPDTNPRWLAKFLADNPILPVATIDNLYATQQSAAAYAIMAGSNGASHKTGPQHILNAGEWLGLWPDYAYAIRNGATLLDSCDATIQDAEMVSPKFDQTIMELCIAGAPSRGIDLSDPVYAERLKREVDLIDEKNFADYFFVIWDMIRYAKTKMLVGPARGSSCGSLVCYLLRITEIDPIPYNLLFERFIDHNRSDYPDIDIDFPDTKRDLIFEYLAEKYGQDCVVRLGTISRYKAKSAVTETASAYNIPKYESDQFKDSIIERSSGDARSNSCILDSFSETEAGRHLIATYPHIKVCGDLEGHARHTGQHAAAICVTSKPMTNYCSVDMQTGAAMLDKVDAEEIGLLKIDALGLRTLGVIEDALAAIGKDYDWMYDYPRDDRAAFDILNDHKFSGIFQFEGYALQSISKQMTVDCFEDLCALTALGRPGPFESGAAQEFVKRKKKEHEVTYIHPIIEAVTGVSFGLVIYQEQVMGIARNVGKMAWKDVGFLRKAMSKSLGKEIFDSYWDKFKTGAMENGLDEATARLLWDQINTMGSWSFNRSHAVAYGLVSYWTMVLKTHYPLEFAAACLRNAKDDEQTILILRELVAEGYSYVPFDWEKSQENWTVVDGVLYGGFSGLKGVGAVSAKKLMDKRKSKAKLTPAEKAKVENPVTPYDNAFEAHALFPALWDRPQDFTHIIKSPITEIATINWDRSGVVVVLAKLKKRNLRDGNELKLLERRGGKLMKGQTFWLNTHIEDDTGQVMATIGRSEFTKWGRPMIDECKIGDWFLLKCSHKAGMQKLFVQRWKKLDPQEFV